MSEKRDYGGPAFPCSNVGYPAPPNKGMTLRDWFAGMALQGEILSKWYQRRSENESWEKCAGDMASDCYEIADAMLSERKK